MLLNSLKPQLHLLEAAEGALFCFVLFSLCVFPEIPETMEIFESESEVCSLNLQGLFPFKAAELSSGNVFGV